MPPDWRTSPLFSEAAPGASPGAYSELRDPVWKPQAAHFLQQVDLHEEVSHQFFRQNTECLGHN